MVQGLFPFLGWIQLDIWLPALTGSSIAVIAIGVGLTAFSVYTRRKNTGPTNGTAAPDAVGPPAFKIPGRAPEKRGFTRRAGNAIPVYFTTSQDDSDAQRGWVLDRSTGGLRLSLENPLEPGTVLRIRPCTTHVTAPWVEIEVKSCRPDETNWELGCQFVKIPSFNVLLLFG